VGNDSHGRVKQHHVNFTEGEMKDEATRGDEG
jgi:hypothetical protein